MMVVCHHNFGFADGFSGVTFFYVLSGFVLAINYQGQVGTAALRRGFWWKRLARIYPTYLLTFAIALPLAVWQIFTAHSMKGILEGVAAIPLNLLMLQSWVPMTAIFFGVNAVAWSLSDEAFFYAVFPVLAGWLARRGRWKVIAIWLAATAALAATFCLRKSGPQSDTITHWLFYIFPATRLIEFAIGVAMGLQFNTNTPRTLGLESELAEFGVIGATFALLAAVSVPWSFRFSLWFLPSAIGVIYVFARSRGPISTFLSHPWLVVLGDASFMLYMIHQLIMRYTILLLGAGLSVRIAAAVASVGLSVVLHFWFERPAQRFVLAFSKRPGRTIQPAVVGDPV
jgi:peptidoglycan/LPS O-acetylase OafA/YrhL